MANYKTIKAQIAKLEKQAADLMNKARADVIAKVKGYIKAHALTAADLGFRGSKGQTTPASKSRPGDARAVGVPKYRDPATGKTWTGRGKPPGWIAAAIKQGKRDAYLIGKVPAAANDSTANVSARKRAAKKAIAPTRTAKKVVARATSKKRAARVKKVVQPASTVAPEAPAAG